MIDEKPWFVATDAHFALEMELKGGATHHTKNPSRSILLQVAIQTGRLDFQIYVAQMTR